MFIFSFARRSFSLSPLQQACPAGIPYLCFRILLRACLYAPFPRLRSLIYTKLRSKTSATSFAPVCSERSDRLWCCRLLNNVKSQCLVVSCELPSYYDGTLHVIKTWESAPIHCSLPPVFAMHGKALSGSTTACLLSTASQSRVVSFRSICIAICHGSGTWKK